jgi:uncharacterized repeat protein (TIGR01451 family)
MLYRCWRYGVMAGVLLGTPGAVMGAPGVTGFSPAHGGPGVQVTITGSGFLSATRVQFDVAAADFVATADNRIVAVVPGGATTGRIRVTNPTGTGTSAVDFQVAPRISGFAPVRSGVGTAVTLEGFNFIGTTAVEMAGKPAAFGVTASTQIRVTVPAGGTNGPIRVVTPAGVAISADDFLVTGPGPIIDSFEPSVGAPGTDVKVHGVNFTNVTGVRFNNVSAPVFSVPAQTLLNVRVPEGATSGKITVTTAGGAAVSGQDYGVTRLPVITNFTPKVGKDGVTDVLIEGINLGDATGVGFNGKSVTGIAKPAEGQIRVGVPIGATTGPITVTNGFGVGTSSNAFVITLAPIIDKFTPVLAGPGTPVTISGVNLSNGVTTLRFNGVTAPFQVTGQNGTQISANVPTTAKTGPITMTNAFGGFMTSSNFFVTGSLPYVTALSPGSGPRGGEVIVTGGNFTSPVTVKFGGVTDLTAAVTAPTQIRATVPPGARTGPVTVATAVGTSTNGPTFYAPPRVTGIAPGAAVVGGVVVLSGTNFTEASVVRFGEVAAAFTVTEPGKIEATVPAEGRSGQVTVVAPGGTFITADRFTVLPHVTSFSPLLGPVRTEVTVVGTSLQGATRVTFNGVNAAFVSESPIRLRATVPDSAVTGPIRVTTPDGVAESPEVFVVTRSTDLELRKTVVPTLVRPGEAVTYTLVASNRGPSIVTGVEIRDFLPLGVSFVSAGIDRGTWTNEPPSIVGRVGILTNGTAVTLTIQGLAQVEGLLTNNAVVTALEGDTFSTNNGAKAGLTVISDASRELRIEDVPGTNRVVLSWPSSPVPMLLETVPVIPPTNGWSAVPGQSVVRDGRVVLTNEQVTGAGFYRLRMR